MALRGTKKEGALAEQRLSVREKNKKKAEKRMAHNEKKRVWKFLSMVVVKKVGVKN